MKLVACEHPIQTADGSCTVCHADFSRVTSESTARDRAFRQRYQMTHQTPSEQTSELQPR